MACLIPIAANSVSDNYQMLKKPLMESFLYKQLYDYLPYKSSPPQLIVQTLNTQLPAHFCKTSKSEFWYQLEEYLEAYLATLTSKLKAAAYVHGWSQIQVQILHFLRAIKNVAKYHSNWNKLIRTRLADLFSLVTHVPSIILLFNLTLMKVIYVQEKLIRELRSVLLHRHLQDSFDYSLKGVLCKPTCFEFRWPDGQVLKHEGSFKEEDHPFKIMKELTGDKQLTKSQFSDMFYLIRCYKMRIGAQELLELVGLALILLVHIDNSLMLIDSRKTSAGILLNFPINYGRLMEEFYQLCSGHSVVHLAVDFYDSILFNLGGEQRVPESGKCLQKYGGRLLQIAQKLRGSMGSGEGSEKLLAAIVRVMQRKRSKNYIGPCLLISSILVTPGLPDHVYSALRPDTELYRSLYESEVEEEELLRKVLRMVRESCYPAIRVKPVLLGLKHFRCFLQEYERRTFGFYNDMHFMSILSQQKLFQTLRHLLLHPEQSSAKQVCATVAQIFNAFASLCPTLVCKLFEQNLIQLYFDLLGKNPSSLEMLIPALLLLCNCMMLEGKVREWILKENKLAYCQWLFLEMGWTELLELCWPQYDQVVIAMQEKLPFQLIIEMAESVSSILGARMVALQKEIRSHPVHLERVFLVVQRVWQWVRVLNSFAQSIEERALQSILVPLHPIYLIDFDYDERAYSMFRPRDEPLAYPDVKRVQDIGYIPYPYDITSKHLDFFQFQLGLLSFFGYEHPVSPLRPILHSPEKLIDLVINLTEREMATPSEAQNQMFFRVKIKNIQTQLILGGQLFADKFIALCQRVNPHLFVDYEEYVFFIVELDGYPLSKKLTLLSMACRKYAEQAIDCTSLYFSLYNSYMRSIPIQKSDFKLLVDWVAAQIPRLNQLKSMPRNFKADNFIMLAQLVAELGSRLDLLSYAEQRISALSVRGEAVCLANSLFIRKLRIIGQLQKLSSLEYVNKRIEKQFHDCLREVAVCCRLCKGCYQPNFQLPAIRLQKLKVKSHAKNKSEAINVIINRVYMLLILESNRCGSNKLLPVLTRNAIRQLLKVIASVIHSETVEESALLIRLGCEVVAIINQLPEVNNFDEPRICRLRTKAKQAVKMRTLLKEDNKLHQAIQQFFLSSCQFMQANLGGIQQNTVLVKLMNELAKFPALFENKLLEWVFRLPRPKTCVHSLEYSFIRLFQCTVLYVEPHIQAELRRAFYQETETREDEIAKSKLLSRFQSLPEANAVFQRIFVPKKEEGGQSKGQTKYELNSKYPRTAYGQAYFNKASLKMIRGLIQNLIASLVCSLSGEPSTLLLDYPKSLRCLQTIIINFPAFEPHILNFEVQDMLYAELDKLTPAQSAKLRRFVRLGGTEQFHLLRVILGLAFIYGECPFTINFLHQLSLQNSCFYKPKVAFSYGVRNFIIMFIVNALSAAFSQFRAGELTDCEFLLCFQGLAIAFCELLIHVENAALVAQNNRFKGVNIFSKIFAYMQNYKQLLLRNTLPVFELPLTLVLQSRMNFLLKKEQHRTYKVAANENRDIEAQMVKEVFQGNNYLESWPIKYILNEFEEEVPFLIESHEEEEGMEDDSSFMQAEESAESELSEYGSMGQPALGEEFQFDSSMFEAEDHEEDHSMQDLLESYHSQEPHLVEPDLREHREHGGWPHRFFNNSNLEENLNIRKYYRNQISGVIEEILCFLPDYQLLFGPSDFLEALRLHKLNFKLYDDDSTPVIEKHDLQQSSGPLKWLFQMPLVDQVHLYRLCQPGEEAAVGSRPYSGDFTQLSSSSERSESSEQAGSSLYSRRQSIHQEEEEGSMQVQHLQSSESVERIEPEVRVLDFIAREKKDNRQKMSINFLKRLQHPQTNLFKKLSADLLEPVSRMKNSFFQSLLKILYCPIYKHIYFPFHQLALLCYYPDAEFKLLDGILVLLSQNCPLKPISLYDREAPFSPSQAQEIACTKLLHLLSIVTKKHNNFFTLGEEQFAQLGEKVSRLSLAQQLEKQPYKPYTKLLSLLGSQIIKNSPRLVKFCIKSIEKITKKYMLKYIGLKDEKKNVLRLSSRDFSIIFSALRSTEGDRRLYSVLYLLCEDKTNLKSCLAELFDQLHKLQRHVLERTSCLNQLVALLVRIFRNEVGLEECTAESLNQLLAMIEGMASGLFNRLIEEVYRAVRAEPPAAIQYQLTTTLLNLLFIWLVLCKSQFLVRAFPDCAGKLTRPSRPIQQEMRILAQFCKDQDRLTSFSKQFFRQSKGMLMSESPFAVLFLEAECMRLLPFQLKQRCIRLELNSLESQVESVLDIEVSREQVFKMSVKKILTARPSFLQGQLRVTFLEEEGEDLGGPSREWFELVSRELFNPVNAIFIPSASKNYYRPNPAIHENYFRFAGRFVAIAILQQAFIEFPLTKWFFKRVLDQPVFLEDIKQEEQQQYNNLQWLLDNSIEDCGLELYFTVGDKELLPEGRHRLVTDENKKEYLQLLCESRMGRDCHKQLLGFKEGFYSVIPRSTLQMLQPEELELLVSGLTTIDTYDMRCNTQYVGYQRNDQLIVWFWEILESFDNSMRKAFLQFVTGSSRVPPEGFAGLRGNKGLKKFSIQKGNTSNELPRAHTCFNQLDLPEYKSKSELYSKLVLAITEGRQKFGFA